MNRYGSYVYGSLLGVFILAIGFRRATARGAFYGLIAGMIAVIASAVTMTWLSYLWFNVIGAVVAVAVGLLLSI